MPISPAPPRGRNTNSSGLLSVAGAAWATDSKVMGRRVMSPIFYDKDATARVTGKTPTPGGTHFPIAQGFWDFLVRTLTPQRADRLLTAEATSCERNS